MPAAPEPNSMLPPSREVASGMTNLGNTCYMNAVLQALAHAPELCMAMDCEPHSIACPVAIRNAEKRRVSPAPPASITTASRKSRRTGPKRSPSPYDEIEDFCALCEVENHLSRAHRKEFDMNGDPVAPSTFVNGFIKHVAPWFKLGVQEDSHEFLRLLIDAMQNSCSRARRGNSSDSSSGKEKENSNADTADKEYPFRLFRGTVESNVTCSSCEASSCTHDPIEDIGLDVTSVTPANGGNSAYRPALAEVSASLERFTLAEKLDSGYKCERCGKFGKATKQSRLASIPPILTLHLKRFRYGSSAERNAGSAGLPNVSRRGRSELSQLTGNDFSGSTGSAKIEGHVKFDQFMDIRPFLTQELQEKHRAMFCRLFAVVVHAGKNSHSGHYVAYVRNVTKNEWWKMDDARVTRVTMEEVINAEAYMLFYRVVDHPIAVQLRTEAKAQADAAAEAAAAVAATINKTVPDEEDSSEKEIAEILSGRKRRRNESSLEFYKSGEEWARAKTNLPPSFMSIFRRAEEFISERVNFKPEFFNIIRQEAANGGEVGKGPLSVSASDIQGNAEDLRRGILELLFQLANKAGQDKFLLSLDAASGDHAPDSNKTESSVSVMADNPKTSLMVSVVDDNEMFL